jgi:hypothetical protein
MGPYKACSACDKPGLFIFFITDRTLSNPTLKPFSD